MLDLDATAPGLDLRAARLAAGLSAATVATVLDVHPTTVLRWERRERQPEPRVLTALADLLGVDRAALAAPYIAAVVVAPAPGHAATGLRALRQEARTSAAAVAALLGVPVHTVYNWEAGRSRLPEQHVPVLASLVGLPATEVVARLRAPAAPHRPPSTALVRMRRGVGMSQQRLAGTVGVARSTVRAWETGRRRPSWHDLRRLAQALGVSTAAVARAAGAEVPVALRPHAWGPGSLPHVLRGLREWSGLTQAQLAALCGCGPDAVRGWEAGRFAPSPEHRETLERLHRLPAGALRATYA